MREKSYTKNTIYFSTRFGLTNHWVRFLRVVQKTKSFNYSFWKLSEHSLWPLKSNRIKIDWQEYWNFSWTFTCFHILHSYKLSMVLPKTLRPTLRRHAKLICIVAHSIEYKQCQRELITNDSQFVFSSTVHYLFISLNSSDSITSKHYKPRFYIV